MTGRPDATRLGFRGRFLRVDVETWPHGEREVVRHPGACAIVATTSRGDVLLVRQFREAVREHLLELPAGILDVAGERSSACAGRELEEETGHPALSVEPLGEICTSPGFADERIELFVATATDEPVGAPERWIEVVRIPFDDAVAAVEDGGIRDAKTVAGLLLAARRAS